MQRFSRNALPLRRRMLRIGLPAALIALAAFFIYLFNYRFCLSKAGLEEDEKKKLTLSLAVFTAPYLFFLPTEWLFY